MNLFVFFCPSFLEPLWRQAIVKASIQRGWVALAAEDIDVAEKIRDAGSAPIIVLSSSPNLAPFEGADFVNVVITDRSTIWTRARNDGANDKAAAEATHWASFYFAKASEMADAGATVVQANAEEITLAGLGNVKRAQFSSPKKENSGDPLDIYRAIPPRPGASSRWPPSLFTTSGKAAKVGPVGDQQDIDLTGRARTLVRGPDIALPPGPWRVDATIKVDPEGGRLHLNFFWGAGGDAVSASAIVSEPGIYRITLDRLWKAVEAADFSVQAYQPHFQGRMKLVDCCVTRLDAI